MASKKPSLLKLVSETTRIITTHPRHFLALSALFLFPISVLNTLFPLLYHPTSFDYNQFIPSVPTPDSEKTVITPAANPQLPIQLIYYALLVIFNICAVSSITHTTINAQNYHSVQLVPSLKSTLVSFLPILGTKLVIGLIFFAFAMSIGIISLVFFFSNVDYTSIYFIAFLSLSLILLAALSVYVGIQWSLTNTVTVYESTWGFAALKRSSYLVKGMRSIVFLMMLLFGIPSLVMGMWYMNLMAKYEGHRTGWVVVPMVVHAGFFTIFPLFKLVSDAVLFVYCKELHGEPVSWIGEKLDVEYAKVPIEMV